MTRERAKAVLGFVGGTGPLGRGLAVRFARAGHAVRIGSREPARAERIAAVLVDAVHRADPDLRGVDNLAACRQADVVFVTVPYAAQRATLPPLAETIGDKIVVNCVNAVDIDAQGPHPHHVPAGSAAEECAQLLPRARVVSAFHDVSARRLLRGEESISVDVLVCGDDPRGKERVVELARELPGMWSVDCGGLRLSGPIEQMTPVLLAINRRYRINAGLRIDGLRRARGHATR